MRETFIHEVHAGGLVGHFGGVNHKTLKQFTQHYYWPSMAKEVM